MKKIGLIFLFTICASRAVENEEQSQVIKEIDFTLRRASFLLSGIKAKSEKRSENVLPLSSKETLSVLNTCRLDLLSFVPPKPQPKTPVPNKPKPFVPRKPKKR